MRRREFITLIAGAAVFAPAVARAQQPMPVIGFLSGQSAEPNAMRMLIFRQALKEAGFAEGENVSIIYRWADNQLDRLPAMAAELVQRQVAVIVSTALSQFAAKAATSTIPIVFSINADPVRLGLVESIARPGGNMTGATFLTAELVQKRLDLLRELVPKAVRIAVLVNPTRPDNETELRELNAAARSHGQQISVLTAGTASEIDAAFATFERDRPDALFVGGDPFFNLRRVQFALLAARYRMPATYSLRDHPEAGGLMSYGTNVNDTYRQIGHYVGRILKGAKPAELPVVQSTKFELIINAQAARTLGLTVPPSLLSIADEVIE